MDIAIVLYPGFTALDAIGPMEVLSSVPGARTRFVAERPGPVVNDTGILTVQVAAALGDLPRPDIILVPGGPGCMAAMRSEPLLTWLRAAHATARWTTSVCTGSLVLGAAGLLRDAPATTHWGSLDDLAPLCAGVSRERFVRHGSLITAAGVSAGIDMALWLARELAGEPMARTIQLAIEYDPHPPFAMPEPPAGVENLTADNWRLMEQRSGRRHPLDPRGPAAGDPAS